MQTHKPRAARAVAVPVASLVARFGVFVGLHVVFLGLLILLP